MFSKISVMNFLKKDRFS